MPVKLTIEQAKKRFKHNSELTETGCREWKKTITLRGYASWPTGIPYFKTNLGHRIAWILENGEIPKGAKIIHTCKNKTCINIDHLRILHTDTSIKNKVMIQRQDDDGKWIDMMAFPSDSNGNADDSDAFRMALHRARMYTDAPVRKSFRRVTKNKKAKG